MSRFMRITRSVVFVILGVCFVPVITTGENGFSWRAMGAAGLLSSLYGLRIILGPALEVRPEALRVMKNWPKRRDIAWYRIFEVDVVPEYWLLSLELNSGERIELPCVERVDDLYDEIQELRQRLDA